MSKISSTTVISGSGTTRQWYRDGKPIEGANGVTFIVQPEDCISDPREPWSPPTGFARVRLWVADKLFDLSYWIEEIGAKIAPD